MSYVQRTRPKRKKYFLYHSSQPEIYGKILLLFLIILVMSSSAFYLLSRKELETEWYRAHSSLKYVTDLFLPWLIIIDIIGIIAVAALLIFLTHKIAGASYRIRKDLEAIRKGSLNTKIKLRKGDELLDIAQSLNMTFSEIGKRIEKAEGLMLDTEMKANAVIHYVNDGHDKNQARKEAVQLAAIVRKAKEELQSFIE